VPAGQGHGRPGLRQHGRRRRQGEEGLSRIGLDAIAAPLRFAASARDFLRQRLTLEEARAIVAARLARRGDAFLASARDGIFRNPRSAYAGLLGRAGIDERGLAALVQRHGLEGALAELRDRGVAVTYEEFKAVNAGDRACASRFGRGTDFRNPRVASGLTVASSASRSGGTRVFLDLENLREWAVHRLLYAAEFGFMDAARAEFYTILPSAAALKAVLVGHYLGQPVEAWFAPVDPARAPLRYRLATHWALLSIRAGGGRTVRPRYVPLGHVAPIARWLAERKREGRRALLAGYATACVRVCEAARDLGLDIAGSGFLMVGEPSTEAKHAAVRAVGGTPLACYSSVDAGFLANACTRSAGADDMHLFTDSFALVRQRPRALPSGTAVEPFLVTSLLPSSPLVLLNVELDDYGDVEERRCDCEWGRLGLNVRISNVRSFVKLTSEGMTFVGSNLVDVIERELPARFGGGPGDYQILEEEDARGHPHLTLLVRPGVGRVDHREVLALLYQRVRSGHGARRLSGDVWEEARTLRVERREPVVTAGGKVFAFHTLRPARKA
jgi:hypothetical protein